MAIEIKQITKTYGRQKALDNVSLVINDGEIVGLLGPNGAGKSTLIKVLCGYLPIDSGRVFIDGHDVFNNPKSIRKNIGYLPENNPLYEELYIKEYLSQIAYMYNLPQIKHRIEKIVNLTGLQKEQHKKIRTLSKGYRQRVGWAQALIHNPKILILDEPTSGMDPNQSVEIRNLIKQIRPGKIILFSSHNLNEVKAVCERIIIIHNGQVVTDIQADFENTAILEKKFFSLTN